MELTKVAAFLAGAALIDKLPEAELNEVIEPMADALELDAKKLLPLVESEFKKLEAMDDDKFHPYFVEQGKGLDYDDAAAIFQCCIQITLANGELCKAEAETLMAFAEVLNIDHADALLFVADIVKDDPELDVSFDDE